MHYLRITFVVVIFLLLACDDNKTKPQTTNTREENTPRDTFILEDTAGKTYSLTLSNGKLLFHKSFQGIVLINLFSTWCNPCEGMSPYLSDLQKKYAKDVFIAGVPTHDLADKKAINSFIQKENLEYFISYAKDNEAFVLLLIESLQNLNIIKDNNFSIPLTLMYVEGNYFTHYEGIVPIEMIDYDIQQAQKQFN